MDSQPHQDSDLAPHDFDEGYWAEHWRRARDHGAAAGAGTAPNPHLVREVGGLRPGTALDAGCGEGREASWLASRGWRVTAVDIAAQALPEADTDADTDTDTDTGGASGTGHPVRWVRADLTTWRPEEQFDLVTTHYAHPAMPQTAFYDRISDWVAPGGTLLIVGHLHPAGHPHTHTQDHAQAHSHDHGHEHRPPVEASVTLADVTALLADARWEIVSAEERSRTVAGPGGRAVELQDVVVRARRRP